MATVREVVLPHHKKEDGTWNVKIRVTHKRKSAYIDTHHFISSKQLRKDFTIKDSFILKSLNPLLDDFRSKLGELGAKIDVIDLPEIISRLTNKEKITAEEINIIKFGRDKIEQLQSEGRLASAANMITVINNLSDFFSSKTVPVTEIKTKMLISYEAYLRKPRTITRINQLKKAVTTKSKGLSDNGIHHAMRDLRILFNNIRDHYNDEDSERLVVKHYPFKKYKLKPMSDNPKRKLTIVQVKSIRDLEVTPNSRMELAKDLFMLSFYLCGTNAVDIWNMELKHNEEGRASYNRSKTKGRRRDRAFISINIPDVANNLYLKYVGSLQSRFKRHNYLDKALSVGMRQIGEQLNISKLEFYDARHVVGDWARNICRFSKDDVALVLNHKDQTNSITDIYISKNWKIIDEVQTAVISLLQNIDSN